MDGLAGLTDLTQESQTLDLVNDFFRFVTGYFEVISTSAPHIYHSALPLSPEASSVRGLYGSQATPMTRVIKGISTLWDPSIANIGCLSNVEVVTWSPCSKFIAIACSGSPEVKILDATTLEQLHTLHSKNKSPGIVWGGLKFSLDGCLLAGYPIDYYDDEEGWIMSWDIHTGGPISYITPDWFCDSVTYSECGTMLGGYFSSSRNIIIYDILTENQIFSHPVTGFITGDIWTHDEYLQYAIVNSWSIAIWVVSFTSGYTPIHFCTLPIPHNFPEEPEALLFSPTLSLLAFTLPGKIFVWDAQGQKILLDSKATRVDGSISFSPDGQFFTYESDYSEFCLYKKSPDGYLPHKDLVPIAGCNLLLISPDGGSIISSSGLALQLWHTNSPPSLQAFPFPGHPIQDAYLEFLPNKSSVAIVESSETVTILDLKSGDPQIVIDADMAVHGMVIVGSRIIVVGSGRSIVLELPGGNQTFDTDSQATLDTCAERALDNVQPQGCLLGFTLDGNEVWCAKSDSWVNGWEIVKDKISGITKLENPLIKEPFNSPWNSSCGYQITDDGWVFSSSWKRLLWLPHQWRSDGKVKGKWNGKILALLHDGLPEVVILELEV